MNTEMTLPTAPIATRRGAIPLPAYVPVTTFGGAYPLDALLRPYLERLAPAVMASYHYARQMKPEERPPLPLMVDSGGFASLRQEAAVVETEEGLGAIRIERGDETEEVRPQDVLALQQRIADVAFTLDFPIAPGASDEEADARQRLTIANARWALRHRTRRDLVLFASVQGWDVPSVRRCAQAYMEEQHAGGGFDGIALGGLVPRARNRDEVVAMVRAVREVIGALPLHVFGLGHPDLLPALFEAGATSVDSSSYVQYAARGKAWRKDAPTAHDLAVPERLRLALDNLAVVQNAVPGSPSTRGATRLLSRR